MARYHYRAFDFDQQLVTGELESENVQQAIAELAARGLNVQSIGQSTPSDDEGMWEATKPGPKRSSSELTPSRLQSHLERICTEGRAIAPALRAYAEEMPRGRRRRELQTMTQVIEHIDSAAAERTLQSLPEYWFPLLSAAALSRDPGRVLRGFLEESQRADERRRQWWSSLLYPFLVVLLATVVLAAISILIVPGFREIFTEFDLELPGLTLLILNIAAWLASAWLLVPLVLLFVLILVVASGAQLLPRSMFAWLPDRIRAQFGRNTAIARFTGFLAELLEADVSIPEALRIAGQTSSRRHFRHAAGRLADKIEAGADVQSNYLNFTLTSTAMHALQTDMPMESRIRVLREMSRSYTERAQSRLSWTRGIVEPLAIIIIGLAVGLVVISLFLPLMKLIQGLSM